MSKKKGEFLKTLESEVVLKRRQKLAREARRDERGVLIVPPAHADGYGLSHFTADRAYSFWASMLREGDFS